MRIIDLGVIGFSEALVIQEAMVAGIARGAEEETLLLLEHLPVYTTGSGGNPSNVLDSALTVRRINRGGDVTYHGPGQVVGYPLLDLSRRGRDLHRCLRLFEQVVMTMAGTFGVVSTTVTGRTGVWTERGKLASIGVGVRRWISMHGFAVNVTGDAVGGFLKINPCGISGCRMTSLEAECGRSVTSESVKREIGACFADLLAQLMPCIERRPM